MLTHATFRGVPQREEGGGRWGGQGFATVRRSLVTDIKEPAWSRPSLGEEEEEENPSGLRTDTYCILVSLAQTQTCVFHFPHFVFVSTNRVAGVGDLQARNWLLSSNSAGTSNL